MEGLEPEVVTALHEPPQSEQLLEAASSADKELIRQLTDRYDTDIDIKNGEGLTALHLALLYHDDTAAEALLDQGADIEAMAPDDRRPLFMAIQEARTAMVQALLERHAAPNAVAQGLTPLHAAASRGNVEVVRLLLDYGADPSALSSDEREPLFFAVKNGNASIAKLLLERDAYPDSFSTEDPPTALHLASANCDIETMQTLLDGGAIVDLSDAYGATPLFRAVAAGDLEAVRLLLQHGASTSIWSRDGQSVLDLAEGNNEMLDLLNGERILRGPRIRVEQGDQPEGHFTRLTPPPPPARNDRDKMVACWGFLATVTDFFTEGEHEHIIPKTISVYELLYSRGPGAIRSRLGEREPTFTWYHLPANNIVWVEGLIRRLAAESGGISSEAYAEAKMDLELSRSSTRRKLWSGGADFSALRPDCRRVPASSTFSLTGDNDNIVSFIPFLHFETFRGHEKMVKTLQDAQKRRTKIPGRPQRHPQPSSRGSASAGSVPVAAGGRSQPTATNRSLRSNAPSQITSDSLPEQNLKLRMESAFLSLIQKVRGWRGRKPGSLDGSASETDLERQPVQHTSGGHGSGAEHNHREPEERRTQDSGASHNGGSSSGPATRDRASNGSARQNTASASSKETDSANDEDRTSALGVHEGGDQVDESPTLKRQESRRRVDPPSGNLNEYLIRGYFARGKPGLQPRRTLDQYVYADIDTNSHRDDDQVVYRYTKGAWLAEAKIFMVDQLWVWILGNDTIITCCPLRWDPWLHGPSVRTSTTTAEASKAGIHARLFGDLSQATHPRAMRQQDTPPLPRTLAGQGFSKSSKKHRDARASQRRPHAPWSRTWPGINPNDPLNLPQLVSRQLLKQGRDAVKSVYELAGLVATCCVDVFDPHHVSEEYMFFDFFERSIGEVNDKVTDYLRQFKEAVLKSKGDVMDITHEIELMIETDDILDELHSLRLVLADQKRVVEDMNRTLSEAAGTSETALYVKTRTLDNHFLHIEQMEQAAKKTHKSLHRLIDLKQKQASLMEARYSRESSRDTARQGKTVLVFTVVTIIFLPVSFIAAIFAIDTNGFPRDAGDKIPFDYLLKYILSIGLGLSIPLVAVAFNVDRIARWLNSTRKFLRHRWQWGVGLSAAVAILLGPVWASELSGGVKAAVSIFVAVLVLVTAIVYAGFRLIGGQKRVKYSDISAAESASDTDEGID